jgi:hypothetical protein
MTAIAAANSSATNAVAALLSNAVSSATEAGGTVNTILQQQTGGTAAPPSNDLRTKTNNDPSVVVTLSSAAMAVSSSAASGQEDFATVANNARATLDAGYQKLGKAPDIYTNYDDWKSAFGGMDRRSLYAVASNEGGQFSKMEQDTAHEFMSDQQAAAMGLTNGTFQSDPAAGYKAGVAFLDSVSPEEKAGSFEWAQQRAAGQYGYESAMRQKGEEPETLDSDSPVVKMLKGAMDALRSLNDASKKLEDMPQYKQAQTAFAYGGNTGRVLDTSA